jgi:diacylglycerol kinase family enzyme
VLYVPVPVALETLERLALDQAAGARAPSKRMLVIVNPYATTVSDRLRNLVVYALRGRYQVDAVDTESPGHATALCREAAEEGYDVIVAFGGDGTVNEVANGLAGTATPMTCLPGGATNVYCRVLGIPAEIVDATEHLLAMADEWRPRRVDLATVNDRLFTFSSGVGLDASVVERVERHPLLKARRYLWSPPRLEVEVAGRRMEGVTAIVQNVTPYTYFNNRPIEIAEGTNLHSGTLAGVVLRRANPLDMPTIAWRAFSRSARIPRHRQVEGLDGFDRLRVRSLDERPLPLEVDGDYLGEVAEAEYGIRPDALTVVS